MAGWMSDCGCCYIKTCMSYDKKQKVFLWFYKRISVVKPSVTRSYCSDHSKTGKFEIELE